MFWGGIPPPQNDIGRPQTSEGKRGVDSMKKALKTQPAADSLALNRKKPWYIHLLNNIKQHPLLYVMAAIVLAYYIIFAYAPMYGVTIAFKDFKPTKGIFGSEWVGLKHFKRFFSSRDCWRVIKNTLSINIGMLLVAFPLPIIFALLLNEIRSKKFVRITQTVTYMPHFVSAVVVCSLLLQFSRDDGILTQILNKLGLVDLTNLFTHDEYFQPLYIGRHVWKDLGWDSIIYFAALSGIDMSMYEAAALDGAGRWKRMWHITIPALLPTIMILLIMRIGSLMSLGWENIVLLDPDGTIRSAEIISSYVYRNGFLRGGTNFSFGAAVDLFNSVINIILLVSANRISRKTTESSLW